MTTLVRLLVCEGACNPEMGHGRLDEEIDAYRKQERAVRESGDSVRPITAPDLVQRLRSLRHTPHGATDYRDADGRRFWACLSCFTTRRY